MQANILHHVWCVEINLSAGCCRDLLVSSIPSLSCMSAVFSSHLFSASFFKFHISTVLFLLLAAVDMQKTCCCMQNNNWKKCHTAVATAIARGAEVPCIHKRKHELTNTNSLIILHCHNLHINLYSTCWLNEIYGLTARYVI